MMFSAATAAALSQSQSQSQSESLGARVNVAAPLPSRPWAPPALVPLALKVGGMRYLAVGLLPRHAPLLLVQSSEMSVHPPYPKRPRNASPVALETKNSACTPGSTSSANIPPCTMTAYCSSSRQALSPSRNKARPQRWGDEHLSRQSSDRHVSQTRTL